MPKTNKKKCKFLDHCQINWCHTLLSTFPPFFPAVFKTDRQATCQVTLVEQWPPWPQRSVKDARLFQFFTNQPRDWFKKKHQKLMIIDWFQLLGTIFLCNHCWNFQRNLSNKTKGQFRTDWMPCWLARWCSPLAIQSSVRACSVYPELHFLCWVLRLASQLCIACPMSCLLSCGLCECACVHEYAPVSFWLCLCFLRAQCPPLRGQNKEAQNGT